jgi:hypothetical protein
LARAAGVPVLIDGAHAPGMVDLANDALKGGPYPKTVMDTYVMAANRQEFSSASASNSGMHTVYTLSEDKYHKSKPAGGRGKAPGRGSGGRGRGRGGSAESLVTSKLASTEPTVTPLSEGTSKGRGGCYHCNDTKHIRANCPLLAKAAVCVVTSDNERDEFDDYEDFDSTVAMFDEAIDLEDKITVLSFRETDVLLDSQGGRSVFKEESLLHDVTLLERPYSLAGIDGSRSKGLSVKHCGSFRDFEKLGNSIGCSARASANVLSMAECVDRGYQVEYSNARDEFILHGDMIAYTFKRQTDTYGRKSKHYIADMSHYPPMNRACVLVETVAENMSTYTKREIDAALKARSIQENRLYESFR